MTMGDFDDSWPSGCPEKYWWIEGDEPFDNFPSEWGANSDDQEVDGGNNSDIPDISAQEDDAISVENPRILELEDLTRYLTELIYEREETALRGDQELTRVSTLNDALAERVATLCTYICKLWLELATGKGVEKRYRCLLIIMVFVVVLAFFKK